MMRRLVPGMLGAALVLAACATDDPDKVRLLQSDMRALEVRLEGLRKAGERDLRLRDLRQGALSRVESVVDDELGAFLLVRRGFFETMLQSLTPLQTSAGGFKWKFASPTVVVENDGMTVSLRFAVTNRRIQKHLGRSAHGTLTGVLQADRDESGSFVFSFVPVELAIDEKDFRAASSIRREVGLDAFEGLVPVFAAPLAPARRVECCGRQVPLTVEFDPDRVAVVPAGMLLPFTLTAGAATATAEPPQE